MQHRDSDHTDGKGVITSFSIGNEGEEALAGGTWMTNEPDLGPKGRDTANSGTWCSVGVQTFLHLHPKQHHPYPLTPRAIAKPPDSLVQRSPHARGEPPKACAACAPPHARARARALGS